MVTRSKVTQVLASRVQKARSWVVYRFWFHFTLVTIPGTDTPKACMSDRSDAQQDTYIFLKSAVISWVLPLQRQRLSTPHHVHLFSINLHRWMNTENEVGEEVVRGDKAGCLDSAFSNSKLSFMRRKRGEKLKHLLLSSDSSGKHGKFISLQRSLSKPPNVLRGVWPRLLGGRLCLLRKSACTRYLGQGVRLCVIRVTRVWGCHQSCASSSLLAGTPCSWVAVAEIAVL